MIRRIVGSSLKARYLVMAVAVALMFFGAKQLRKMPVDILPEFTPPFVEIQTEALGLSPEEVEQFITVPLEQDLLNGVPWLQTIRSEALPGLSSIVLLFEPGTDLMRARQMVAERLTQAAVALPHVSKAPTILQPLSSSSRVMIIGLSSKNLSLIQMSVLARWTIGPRLATVPGVANVSVWGNRDRQLQVQVVPEKLRARGVSLLEVLESTGNALWVSSLSFVEASSPGTGGFIETAHQRLGIRHVLPIVSAAGLAQVPIEDHTGVVLGDVANVVENHQPLIGDAISKEGSSLLLVVEKFPRANTLDVTREVENAIAALRPGLPGLEMDPSIFRPASFIENTLGNVKWALILGSLLVVLALLAFHWDWRTALISLAAISVSLMAGGLVLYLQGATMNALVLAGMVVALGVLVDDAIIDVQNIVRRLRQARSKGSRQSTASIILEASAEMRSAVLFATLIVLLAALPIFFMEGLSGSFFQPLALSYALAALASVAVALTVTPALCLIFLASEPAERRSSPLVGWLQPRYDGMLASIIHRPLLAYVTIGIIAVVGLAVLPMLGRSLLPAFKERHLQVHLKGAPGTSQPEMSRVASLVSGELRAIPRVRNVSAHIGRAVRGDQVVNVNSAELWLSIDSAANYDKTVAAIENVVQGYPGLEHDVLTYLKEKTRGLEATPNDSIVARVYGHDQGILRSKAEELRQAITGVGGVADVNVKLPIQEPTMEIEVNLVAAQSHGLKPGDVRRAAATMFAGIQVGNLFEDQKVFDVVVWSTPESRHSIDSIREMLISTPSGGQVRMGDVAAVRMTAVPNVIQRNAVSRYLDVTATVRGRDLGAVAADVQSRIKKIQFPLEYHAEVLGEYAERQAAHTRLVVVAAAALIGIFFLLQAALQSWRLAAFSFVILALTLVGGLVAVLATGGILSLGSLLGFLTVFGIAARNGILLIKHYQHLERYEGEAFGSGLIMRGARERIAPILMTAFVTGLALVPALLLGDIPGLEILRPLAVVVLGGLVTSTLLNLFIVPAVYLGLRVGGVQDLELAPVPVGTPGTLGGAAAFSSMDAAK